MSRNREFGKGRLKVIFWVLLFAFAIFTAIKVVPAYVDNFQLQDKMQTEARYATVNRRTDDELRDVIYREIQDRGIPARKEDIHIENSPRSVRISVAYSVPVDLKVYEFRLHFNPAVENRSLYY